MAGTVRVEVWLPQIGRSPHFAVDGVEADIEEVAAFFGVDPETIRVKCAKGIHPRFWFINRQQARMGNLGPRAQKGPRCR
jgi:hypothetical protein